MAPSIFSLGLRSLWRDLRAGELRLLILAVTLAVAALTSVGFFADRLQRGMQRDALQLLGGDAVVSSDRPTPQAFVARATAAGLRQATSTGFPTMARATQARGGATKLVALKVVQPGYPLRGNLSVASAQDALGTVTRDIPAAGEAWVDAALLEALALQAGDSLLLGEASLRIARVIVVEPDRGGGFINFAPRVMINQGDLQGTGLLQPASRVTYRFAVAGEGEAMRDFIRWATLEVEKPQVRGVRLESMESGRPEMSRTLDRAEKFLNLVALLAALLCAVAVGLAGRGYASSHLDDCAMLRVLGQSQRRIAWAYMVAFGVAGIGASLAGVLIGLAVHQGFVLLMAGLIDASLPPPGIWPAAFGLGMGLTLLAAFGLPPVLQLSQVSALRVIRRDLGGLKPASSAVLGLGVAGFAALLLAASSDWKLGLIAVGGFAGAVLVFAAASWVAVKLLRAGVNERTAPRWLVLATRQISARPAYAVVQVSSLAVGLLALVLLVLLRTDLIASWRKATPPDAPNRFVINVQPDQAQAFQQVLKDAKVGRHDWFPMFRGRLVAINEHELVPESLPDDRARRMVDREFNLSHSLRNPQHNEIVAGRWTEGDTGGVSVEESVAETLGLKLGDQLRFDVAGTPLDARITSIRKVDWGSMRANFYVLYPVATMPEMPITYMAAFRAPERKGFDNALVRQFPNITNVDMSSTLAQVQRVLDQVIRAVEFLFGFTLAAGLVVLLASVSATREERAREFAIMRAVGAQGSLLRQVQRAELAGIGLLAGALASLAAMAVGWGLAKYVFGFDWTASPWVPLLGALAGAVLALAAGWWGLREVLRRPVIETLRRAAS